MTNVPIDAKVQCTDGPCGHSTNVIINPVTHKVTHFALKEKSLPDNPTRLLPVSLVTEVTPKQITLNCSKGKVASMPPFIVEHFVAQSGADSPIASYKSGDVYHSDYVVHDIEGGSPYSASRFRQVEAKNASSYGTVAEEAVPEGELSLHSGMQVVTDGDKVGKLDALVLDPESGELTHFLMRKGHLWGKKDVAIPITAVTFTDSDSIHINVDKKAIEELPAVSVK